MSITQKSDSILGRKAKNLRTSSYQMKHLRNPTKCHHTKSCDSGTEDTRIRADHQGAAIKEKRRGPLHLKSPLLDWRVTEMKRPFSQWRPGKPRYKLPCSGKRVLNATAIFPSLSITICLL